MFPSSLLIKIFGVAVAGFLTIGVPVIVQEANKTAERKELFDKLFPGRSITETFKGEKFSGQLFDNWNPNEQQQKYLFEEWRKIVKYLPKEFFVQFLSDYHVAPTPTIQLKDTCYLVTDFFNLLSDSKPSNQYIKIPFLKTKLQQPTPLQLTEEQARGTISDDLQFLKQLYEITEPHLDTLLPQVGFKKLDYFIQSMPTDGQTQPAPSIRANKWSAQCFTADLNLENK